MATATRGSYASIDRALNHFGERVDRLRQDLYYCDAARLSPIRRDLLLNIQAGTYVWLAAALESAVRDVLGAVLDHVNSAGISLAELRLSLFALIESPQFDSLQQVRGLRMWQSRAQVFKSVNSTSTCSLRPDALPLDGRTIKTQHLETIWHVFGFQGDSVPSPLHRLALRDLAEARNDIAHGQEDAGLIAGRKSVPDLLRFMDRIEEVATHIWMTTYDYLDRNAYKR
jgi:MAE_28990/MAE_18760-like HEPN